MSECDFVEEVPEIGLLTQYGIDISLEKDRVISQMSLRYTLYSLQLIIAYAVNHAITPNGPIDHSQVFNKLTPIFTDFQNQPLFNEYQSLLPIALLVALTLPNVITLQNPMQLPEEEYSVKDIKKLNAEARKIQLNRQTQQINNILQPFVGLDILFMISKNLDLAHLSPTLHLALFAGSYIITVIDPALNSIKSYPKTKGKTPLEYYIANYKKQTTEINKKKSSHTLRDKKNRR